LVNAAPANIVAAKWRWNAPREWGGYANSAVNAIAEMPKYRDGFLELSDEPDIGVDLHDEVLNW
jgi:L-alanine-DL-glutamate epimerase-like enolase superfamily enzyme